MIDNSDITGDTRSDLLLRAANHTESLHATLIELWKREKKSGASLSEQAARDYADAVEAAIKRLPADGTEPEKLP